MAGAAWDDDLDPSRVESNLVALASEIISGSCGSREQPTLDLAKGWHRRMLEGVAPPEGAYVGRFRGDSHPALIDYEVAVDSLPAVRAANVEPALQTLVLELQQRISYLDDIDAQAGEMLTASLVEEVVEVAAWLHGEWVRIHPFVNGNGRTARMWVLWVCARYGLPQLLPLRPRPDFAYGPCSRLSMTGEHGLFRQYLLLRYNEIDEPANP